MIDVLPVLSNNYLKYKWLIKTLHREQNPILYCPEETHFKCEDISMLKTFKWKTVSPAKLKQKKAGVAV